MNILFLSVASACYSTAESSILFGISSYAESMVYVLNILRLPVPSLWLDVLQKIKAMGYTGVSFYVDWALLEAKQGYFTAEGIFDLNPLFEAAAAAGLYLLAVSVTYLQSQNNWI